MRMTFNMDINTHFDKLRVPFSCYRKQLSLICFVSLCRKPTQTETSTAMNNAVAGKHHRGEFAGYHLRVFSTHFHPILHYLRSLRNIFTRAALRTSFCYHLMVINLLNKKWGQFRDQQQFAKVFSFMSVAAFS